MEGLKKILKKIRFFSYDRYVPYIYKSPFRFLDKIYLYRFFRINFWNFIFSRIPEFSPYYREIQNEKYPNVIKNIYKNGYSLENEFCQDISKEDLNLLRKSAYDAFSSKHGFGQVEVLGKVKDKICEDLEKYSFHFFPKKYLEKNPPKVYARLDISKNGIDPSPKTANWHVDRFIPTLNAIWFPFGCDWGAFEKEVGNPKITSREKNLYLNNLYEHDKVNTFYKDFGRETKKFENSNNFLIIGTHHLQHRRSPITTPGERFAIFIDFYNCISSYELIMKGIKSV